MYKIKDYQFKSFILIANMHHSNYATLVNDDCKGKGIKYCHHLDFCEEYQVLTGFNHKQIPKAYDHGKEMMYKDDKEVLIQNYILLDHMGTHDFNTFFKSKLKSNLTGFLEDFIEAFISACDPLSYIHSLNFLHTDIKPGHLMLDAETNTSFFIDFELVIKKAGLLKGYSKDYASPEYEELLKLLRHEEDESRMDDIAKDIGLDDRTDIYSFGALMYETLTQRQWSVTKSPPREINNLIPLSLEKIILAMLEKDPANRIATADELKQALQKAL